MEIDDRKELKENITSIIKKCLGIDVQIKSAKKLEQRKCLIEMEDVEEDYAK